MNSIALCVLAAVSMAAAACGGGSPTGGGTHPPNMAVQAAKAPLAQGSVAYKDGLVELEGYMVQPSNEASAKLPAVLVVHDWMGLSDDTKMRANMLAELGYVAFAADVYGKGVRPADAAEAGKFAGSYKSDVSKLRARMQSALKALLANPKVDPTKVVVIGYCFGGTSALELARSGAQLAATVSFHGGLATPNAADAKNIRGRVLALHGADDPWVNAAEVSAFQSEMRAAKVDMQFVSYSGAVHAFTVKAAGKDPSKGAAYNAQADARSWTAMKTFLGELWSK